MADVQRGKRVTSDKAGKEGKDYIILGVTGHVTQLFPFLLG